MAAHVRQGVQDENTSFGANAKKMGGVLGVSGNMRRPLQDFSNKLVDPVGAGRLASKAPARPSDASKAPGHHYATRSRVNGLRTQRDGSTAHSAQQSEDSAMSWSQVLERRAEEGRRSSVVSPPSPLPDIDSQDKSNPLAATEYVQDIFAYYKRVQSRYHVAPDYMTSQADINEKMRAILIDWLVEVHLKFKLMPETLYLTVNLIDRYLAKKQVTRKNLQLVGVTAMLIASKYEEIWAPEVKDFVYISDRAYTKEQILQMEKLMLNELAFHLTVPTIYPFLHRFIKASNAERQTGLVAGYLVELALVDYAMLKYQPSLVACAAMYVANAAMHVTPRLPYALERHSGHTEAEVLPCAQDLTRLMAKAPGANLVAVYKKYGSQKFNEVANTPAPQDLADAALHA